MPKLFTEGNLFSHLAETAVASPDQLALVSSKEGLFEPCTFSELHQSVLKCSALLKSKGISSGDKVLLFVKPGYELTVIAFSLIFLGAIPVVIDPGMGLKSVLSCIHSTRPTFLIAIPPIYWGSFLFHKSFKSLKGKFLVAKKHFQKEIESISFNPVSAPIPTKEDDLAAIVFTSGSTGPPKGVCYLHRNFNAQIRSLKENFNIQPGETDLSTLPVFSLFNPALGVTTVLPEMDPRKPSSADPEKLIETIQKYGVTSAFASPVIGHKILTACLTKKIRLSSMKRILLAGAPSPPSLILELSKILENGKVYIPYGATEALPVAFCTANTVKKNLRSVLEGKGSLLGKEIPGITIGIFPNRSQSLCGQLPELGPLDDENVGEICVSGDVVTHGYFRKPGATADSRFVYKNREFHRMGDLGYFDSHGCLRFLGRKVEAVATRGGLLETERCEPMINEINGVSKSALIGIGERKVQEPCMVVQPDESIGIDECASKLRDSILSILNHNFPNFGFKRVIWEKKIPVDARHNAKIHRLALSKKWNGIIEKDHLFGIPK